MGNLRVKGQLCSPVIMEIEIEEFKTTAFLKLVLVAWDSCFLARKGPFILRSRATDGLGLKQLQPKHQWKS